MPATEKISITIGRTELGVYTSDIGDLEMLRDRVPQFATISIERV